MELRDLTQGLVIGDAALGGAVVGEAEAVREDLVHDAAAKPRGRLELGVVHRQAEAALAPGANVAEIARLVGAQPVGAALGLHIEGIPEGHGLGGDREVYIINVILLLHRPAAFKVVAPDNKLRPADPAAAAAEGQAQIPAHAHRAVVAAVLLETGVVDEGGYLLHRAAQDADHVGGAGLIGLDILGLNARAAQVVAAGGDNAVGLLELHAAVVHQDAQKLRRGQRLALGLKDLV